MNAQACPQPQTSTPSHAKTTSEGRPTVPTTRKYRCLIRWRDKKYAAHSERGSAEGTSIRRAASQFLLGFFSNSSTRKKHADAHTHLQLEIWREKKPIARAHRRHA
jgi:hypothetical protein